MNKYDSGITIIVPFFNTEDYIEECLASILSQSYVRKGGVLAVICVDDASSDNSAEAALRMFEFEPKVKCRLLSHEINKGLAAARNSALSLVSTQYVMFVDSDDMLKPNCLESLHREMESRKADVGIFEYRYFSPSGTFYPRNYSQKLFKDYSYLIEGAEMNLSAVHALSACNKIYLVSFIDQTKFCEKRSYSEDVTFWFEVLAKSPKAMFIANATYFYRKREDIKNPSIIDSRDTTARNYFEYLDILEELRVTYQNSTPQFYYSISWFSQKSLFFYIVRFLNLPNEQTHENRAQFMCKARNFVLHFNVERRLPVYQRLIYFVFRSKFWRFIYLVGYVNRARNLSGQLVSRLRLIRFSVFRKVYALFSLAYLRELPAIVKYIRAFGPQDNIDDQWLLGERGYDAGDNALALFEFLSSMSSFDKELYYVCSGDAYTQLNKSYSNVLLYGSKSHLRVFSSSGVLISTHSRGNIEPFKNKFLLSLLSRNYRRKKYVFLGHGITKDDMSTMLGKGNTSNANFDLVWCGSKMEYRDIALRYGYPKNKIKCAPLPRWQWPLSDSDDQCSSSKVSNVMIMFTWRDSFGRNLRSSRDLKERFEKEYLVPIRALLQAEELKRLSAIKNVRFHCVLHPETELALKHHNLELRIPEYIEKYKSDDIPYLIQLCDFLVTDYSSITFDFAFYQKPTIYYQFDRNNFRKLHYKSGYFDYDVHGFGPACSAPSHCVELVADTLKAQPSYFLMRRHLHFQYEGEVDCLEAFRSGLNPLNN